MLEQELKEVWQKLKELWKSSSRTDKINYQISRLITGLKGKISQFEKDSITRDITKITASIKNIIYQLRTNK